MSPLLDLPNELLAAIARQLPSTRDKSHFGIVCHHLLSATAPELYRSITLRSDKPDLAFSAFAAVRWHGHLVKELTVVLRSARLEYSICDVCNDLFEEGQGERQPNFAADTASWESASGPILELLRGSRLGSHTPNLRILNIEFPKDYDDTGDDEEDDRQTLDRTFERMDSLLAAAAANSYPTITTLRLLNLPDHPSSVYRTPSWQRLLGRLDCFELALYPDYTEIGWRHNSTDNFRDFVQGLTENIFDHLLSVKRVKVTAPGVGHTQGDNTAPFHLGRGTMPKLTDLELDGMVIGDNFCDFMEHRPSEGYPLNLTFTSVVNHYWWGSFGDNLAPVKGLKWWHEVFSKMTAIIDKPDNPALRSFQASFLEVSGLTSIGDELTPLLKKLAAHCPERVIFPYVSLVNDGGEPRAVGERSETMLSFCLGKDQAAFDEFVARVARSSGGQ